MSEMLNDRTQGQDQIPEVIVYILEMFITSQQIGFHCGQIMKVDGYLLQSDTSCLCLLELFCLLFVYGIIFQDYLSRINQIKSDIVK